MNQNLLKEVLNNVEITSSEIIINAEYFEKKVVPEIEKASAALQKIESLEEENKFLKKVLKVSEQKNKA